jgi:hypothetical protein
MAVCTVYATEPLLALFDPIIDLPGMRPRRHVDLDGSINFPAICCGELLQVVAAEIPSELEHGCDSGWERPGHERGVASSILVTDSTTKSLIGMPARWYG